MPENRWAGSNSVKSVLRVSGEDDGSMPPKTMGARVRAARAFAVVSAFFWIFPFFGLIDLTVPFLETPGFYDAYLLETGWGVMYTFLVGAAFVSLAVRPGMVMPVVQVLLGVGCLAVTAVASASWVQLVPAMLLAGNAYAFLVLAGNEWRLSADWYRRSPDPLVGVVAGVLVPLAAWFAVDMVLGFREGRPPMDDDTWFIDHWPTQGALALSAATVAVASAVAVRASWSGTAVSAGSVAAAAAWFGYWSATYPNHAGSAGAAGGMVLIGWAVAFAGVVAWRLARPASPPAHRKAGSSS